jgi:histone H2A
MSKKQPVSKSGRAGLELPVGKLQTHLKRTLRAKRVSGHAPLYLAAAVEEVLQALLKHAHGNTPDSRNRVFKRNLLAAMRSDKDMSAVFGGYTSASTQTLKAPGDSIVSSTVLKYRAEKAAAQKKAA